MTELRKQLDILLRDYRAQLYPGNLAEQLLGNIEPAESPVRPSPLRTSTCQSPWLQISYRMRLGLAWAGGALAASIGLLVLLYEPAASAVQNSVARLSQAAHLPFFEVGSPAASTPDAPFSVIPEFRSLDVSVPLDWSVESASASAATTREAA